jgi:hypothetical protein
MRSVGEAIWPGLLHNEACPSWASGELRTRPLLEEALGRGVNSLDYCSCQRLGSGEAISRPLSIRSLGLNCAHQSLQLVLMAITSRV